MTKGTQWTIKTPRLRCKCGRVVHFQSKGRWTIIYDSEPPAGAQNTLSSLPSEEEEHPTAEGDSDG